MNNTTLDRRTPEAEAGRNPADLDAVWSAHQQALTVGRLIELHHADIHALLGHAQAGTTLDPDDTRAVRSYREDLQRIRAVIEMPDSRLKPYDGPCGAT